jgi:hypothetical protein
MNIKSSGRGRMRLVANKLRDMKYEDRGVDNLRRNSLRLQQRTLQDVTAVIVPELCYMHFYEMGLCRNA